MVTVPRSFSLVANVATFNDRRPAVILSAAVVFNSCRASFRIGNKEGIFT